MSGVARGSTSSPRAIGMQPRQLTTSDGHARPRLATLLFDRVTAIGRLLAAMRRVARTARSTDRLHRGAGLRPVAGGGSGLEVHRRVQRALREAGCIARVAPGPVLAHLGEDVRERLGVHLYGVGLPVLDALLETVGREGDGPHPADVRNHLGAWRGSLPAAA